MQKGNKKEKISSLIYDSYLATIRNSIGCSLFRSYYSIVNGNKTDILNNGELSCAFFVSSILVIFRLIEKIHMTVDSTEKDLTNSGWKKIKKPVAGSVLIWKEKTFPDGSKHRHIGFYIGKGKAISNNYKTGTPFIHDWLFRNGENRKASVVYWKGF